ncbi:MAG: O-antigen export system permease protein RfbD, partial [uncultured Actinomycetospora sp.]
GRPRSRAPGRRRPGVRGIRALTAQLGTCVRRHPQGRGPARAVGSPGLAGHQAAVPPLGDRAAVDHDQHGRHGRGARRAVLPALRPAHRHLHAVRDRRLHDLVLHQRLRAGGHRDLHRQRGPHPLPARAADDLRLPDRVAADPLLRPQRRGLRDRARDLLQPARRALPDDQRRPRHQRPARHPAPRTELVGAARDPRVRADRDQRAVGDAAVRDHLGALPRHPAGGVQLHAAVLHHDADHLDHRPAQRRRAREHQGDHRAAGEAEPLLPLHRDLPGPVGRPGPELDALGGRRRHHRGRVDTGARGTAQLPIPRRVLGV